MEINKYTNVSLNHFTLCIVMQLDNANTEFGKCLVFTRVWVLAAESALDPAFSISTAPFKDSPWGVSETGTSELLCVGSHDLLQPF